MRPLQRLVLMALLVAMGVAASTFSPIPFLGAKLFPFQHAINVVAGVILGPVYAGITALVIAITRIITGTGSPMAIPGSVFGAVLAGLLYRQTRHYIGAMVGEVIGTGLIGAVAAFPVAVLIMGNEKAAGAGVTFFIIPFALSSAAGALLGGALLPALNRAGARFLAR